MCGLQLPGQWWAAKSHAPTYHTSTQGPRSCQTRRKEFGTQRTITIRPLPAKPSGPIQPGLPSPLTSATTHLLPGSTGLSSPPSLFIPNRIQSRTLPDHSSVPQNQAMIYQLPVLLPEWSLCPLILPLPMQPSQTEALTPHTLNLRVHGSHCCFQTIIFLETPSPLLGLCYLTKPFSPSTC